MLEKSYSLEQAKKISDKNIEKSADLLIKELNRRKNIESKENICLV